MTTRLDEIRARLEEATPVPWAAVKGGLRWEVRSGIESSGYHGVATTHSMYRRDADLIANAPADLAYLLGEVERVTHQRDALQALEGGWAAQQVADYLQTATKDRQALECERDEAMAALERMTPFLDELAYYSSPDLSPGLNYCIEQIAVARAH